MGGDLPARPAQVQAPRFVVWAVKDPDSGNLDRAQIIKVWVKKGRQREKIFEVAVSGKRTLGPMSGKMPAVGNTMM